MLPVSLDYPFGILHGLLYTIKIKQFQHFEFDAEMNAHLVPIINLSNYITICRFIFMQEQESTMQS